MGFGSIGVLPGKDFVAYLAFVENSFSGEGLRDGVRIVHDWD